MCVKCILLKVISNVIFSFRPWDKDRYLAPDIEAATELLRRGKVKKITRCRSNLSHLRGLEKKLRKNVKKI